MVGMATGVTALAVVSASCVTTAGLAGGPDPTADASADTNPANPNPCGKDLQSDPGNCGMCGNACGFGADSFPLCTAGVCKIGCNTQYGNCDNNDKNGCEDVLASDPLNCNACGRNCGGGTCLNGQCGPVNLAPTVDAGLADGYPVAFTMDATSIFYSWYSTTLGTYDIVKLDKTTRVATLLAAVGNLYIPFLAADADPNGFVYFTRTRTSYSPMPSGVPPYATPTGDGAIMKLAKTSADGGVGAPVVLAGSSASGDFSGGLMVDNNTQIVVTATGIYFSVYGLNFYNGITYVPVGSGVYKCPLTGACSSPTALANQYGTYSLAVDGTGFVFGNAQTQTVLACPLLGCSSMPTPVQTSVSARVLFQDATNYYWINQTNASVVKVDRATNTATTLALGQPSPYALAVDDKNVYWAGTNNPTTINSCAIAGCMGSGTSLVPNVTYMRGLAVDDKAIYWLTTSTGGSIFRVVK